MRALSTRNDDPAEGSRPFDKDRDGFVIGRRRGIVVLEELERAQARGARIYCELVGYGMSRRRVSHLVALRGRRRRHPGHAGGAEGRRRRARAVDYVNVHGTSTPSGDQIEIDRAQGGVRRPRAQARHQLHQVDDGPPAGRGGRPRGGHHAPWPCATRSCRRPSTTTTPTPSATSTACRTWPGRPKVRLRALQLLRLRRHQRRAALRRSTETEGGACVKVARPAEDCQDD